MYERHNSKCISWWNSDLLTWQVQLHECISPVQQKWFRSSVSPERIQDIKSILFQWFTWLRTCTSQTKTIFQSHFYRYAHSNWNMRSEMWLAIDSQCANKMCIAWILSTPFRKAVLELLKSDISNAENRLFENKYANRAFCKRKWEGER